VPSCRGTDLPIFVEAFLDDPHFVCIAPMSPADTIRRGQNFNRGFEFKVAHKVEAITQTQNPSGGPPRRHTFNPHAGSPKGAYGLTQLMPGTAKELGVDPDYRTNPSSQVYGGATYLARMLSMFDGNIVLGLASYNDGPGNVQKYGGVPPFKETQHYVQVIPTKYNEYLAAIGGVDALGTIAPVNAAGANLAMMGDGASAYGGNMAQEIAAIAHRLKAILSQMEQNQNPTQAWALNSYARAEMARIMTLRVRVLAANTKTVSAEALQQAAAHTEERNYMTFSND
jgi:hypothetical protein